MKTCKTCKHWVGEEHNNGKDRVCAHPRICGDDIVYHLCWGDPVIVTNKDFGCILWERKIESLSQQSNNQTNDST